MIATSNEADSSQSLAVMAQNLAREILEFCRGTNFSALISSPPLSHRHTEKCPFMIYESSTQGRVSFIGHSVGGLIIRKCLEVSFTIQSF
jgi:hypothetical protein